MNIETVGSQILFAGYRFFLAGAITFVIACLLEKRVIRISTPSIPYIMGIGFLQTTLQYVFFYIGLSHLTGTKGSIINASSAFVSIVLAHFIIKDEKMTFKKGAGCLIGFAGVVIINLGGINSSFSFMGEGMIIISTALYGVSSVLMKLILRRGTPMAITAYQLLFGGAVLVVMGLAAGGRVIGFDGASVALLIYMALISTVGFSIWTALLKYNPVGKVAVFGFSIPVFGVLLSSLFLGEAVLSFQNLSALLCVSVGILIVNIKKGDM